MTDIPLRIIPLGGLGEIGQNMMAIEYDREIVVIDAGVLFTSEDIPGIDFSVPDITYLIENRERFRAILVTHGHEDHIGALPYVLSKLEVPVYSSRLAHGLITVKLRETGLLKDARLNVIEPHTPFKIGPFGVEFFRVCHSIPDAMGIAIRTPLGLIVHTGDFKIDHTPADGKYTDFSALAQLTAEGTFLLLSDSTYAEVPGYTESEQMVGMALDRIIDEAPGRVIVATFASLISRIQQVVNAAVRQDRKVATMGRSMANNAKMASKLGYLNAPSGTMVSLNEIRKLPHNRVVIVATGSQGEPTSALVRIANREHQDIEIMPGDTVVISASPIPGNETVVAKTIDNLFRQGATVLYSRIAKVHVHGHASQEELKMMLNLVRPKFFVPVHGEHRHLVAHTSIAQSMGIPKSKTFVLENGDVLELNPKEAKIVEKVHSGRIYIDGRKEWEEQSDVLNQRRRLAQRGIVTVTIVLNKKTGEILNQPEVTSYGFLELEESQELLENASKKILAILERKGNIALDWEQLKAEVKRSISDFLYQEVRQRPIVLTTIKEV